MMKAPIIVLITSLTVMFHNGFSWANPAIMTLEPDTDRPGQDYKNFDLSLPNPDICLAECEKDQKCLAYTYVKPGFQGAKARCWLKNGIPPSQSPCCNSGIKSYISGPQKGLTAYWSFDEEHRNPAHVFDLSGNNHHGSIEGATFVKGMKGDAASFDGVDDFISILPSAFPNSTDGSLAFWVYLKDGSNGRAFSTSNKNWVWYGFRTTGKLYLTITNMKLPGGKRNGASVGSEIKYNQWKHVAWTWEYNAKKNSTLIKAYQDGFEMQSQELSGKVLVPDNAVYIGKRGGEYFNGSVDELRLYDRALSEKEIQGIEKNVLVSFVSTLMFPEEKPRLEISVMNPAIAKDLRMKITAENNGNITYSRLITHIQDGVIPLTFNQFFNKHDIKVKLIDKKTGQLNSTLAGEIFVEKRKNLHELVYLSFDTPLLGKLNPNHISVLENSPYDAMAVRPRKQRPTKTYKFDSNNVGVDLLKKSSKDFHPWIHLTQIARACPNAPESMESYKNIKGLDIYNKAGMLAKFYENFEAYLNLAKELKSSSIIIDPELYGNCSPGYGIDELAILQSKSIKQTAKRLQKIGRVLAKKVNTIYPELQYLVFLFTHISQKKDIISHIVTGILKQANNKKYNFKLVDGGEGWGVYLNCSLEELKRKSINRFSGYHEYLEMYPNNFELGGVIKPYYDSGKQGEIVKKCGSSLRVKNIKDHLPLLKYMFSTNKYVWIYAAKPSGPYDMFDIEANHASWYEPTIEKALIEAGRCNLNKSCDLGENKTNCPSDCP